MSATIRHAELVSASMNSAFNREALLFMDPDFRQDDRWRAVT